MEPVRVIVSIRGGMVIDVEHGHFVDVTIRDYDTDGLTEEEIDDIFEDAFGNKYSEEEW